MPIIQSDTQEQQVDETLKSALSGKKTTLWARNKVTGWPMLQVVYLAPGHNQPNTFGFVMSGGHCHDGSQALFSLIKLLSATHKSSPKLKSGGGEITPNAFNMEHTVGGFKASFFKNTMQFHASDSTYGWTYGVHLGFLDDKNIAAHDQVAIANMFDHRHMTARLGMALASKDTWSADEQLNANQIRQQTGPAAIFDEDNFTVNVDFGVWLKQAAVSNETIQIFAQMLNVAEYQKHFQTSATAAIQSACANLGANLHDVDWSYVETFHRDQINPESIQALQAIVAAIGRFNQFEDIAAWQQHVAAAANLDAWANKLGMKIEDNQLKEQTGVSTLFSKPKPDTLLRQMITLLPKVETDLPAFIDGMRILGEKCRINFNRDVQAQRHAQEGREYAERAQKAAEEAAKKEREKEVKRARAEKVAAHEAKEATTNESTFERRIAKATKNTATTSTSTTANPALQYAHFVGKNVTQGDKASRRLHALNGFNLGLNAKAKDDGQLPDQAETTVYRDSNILNDQTTLPLTLHGYSDDAALATAITANRSHTKGRAVVQKLTTSLDGEHQSMHVVSMPGLNFKNRKSAESKLNSPATVSAFYEAFYNNITHIANIHQANVMCLAATGIGSFLSGLDPALQTQYRQAMLGHIIQGISSALRGMQDNQLEHVIICIPNNADGTPHENFLALTTFMENHKTDIATALPGIAISITNTDLIDTVAQCAKAGDNVCVATSSDDKFVYGKPGQPGVDNEFLTRTNAAKCLASIPHAQLVDMPKPYLDYAVAVLKETQKKIERAPKSLFDFGRKNKQIALLRKLIPLLYKTQEEAPSKQLYEKLNALDLSLIKDTANYLELDEFIKRQAPAVSQSLT